MIGTAAPWDANEYFDVPSVRNVPAGTAQSVQICKADNNRVGLIISVATGASNNAYVGPGTNVAPGVGIQLVNTAPWMAFTHAQWGALIAAEWWGNAQGTGASFSVIELTLNAWPIDDPAATQDVRDQIANLADLINSLASKINGTANRQLYGVHQGAG